MLLTHAHEDHVGALPYLMRDVKVPEVWGTRLTLGLLQSKLDEHGLAQATELREARPEEGAVEIGSFRAEFIRMAHSVPDTVAIVLEAVQLAERDVPDYVAADHSKMTATYARKPALSDVPYPVQMEPNLVVEFYSR